MKVSLTHFLNYVIYISIISNKSNYFYFPSVTLTKHGVTPTQFTGINNTGLFLTLKGYNVYLIREFHENSKKNICNIMLIF